MKSNPKIAPSSLTNTLRGDLAELSSPTRIILHLSPDSEFLDPPFPYIPKFEFTSDTEYAEYQDVTFGKREGRKVQLRMTDMEYLMSLESSDENTYIPNVYNGTYISNGKSESKVFSGYNKPTSQIIETRDHCLQNAEEELQCITKAEFEISISQKKNVGEHPKRRAPEQAIYIVDVNTAINYSPITSRKNMKKEELKLEVEFSDIEDTMEHTGRGSNEESGTYDNIFLDPQISVLEPKSPQNVPLSLSPQNKELEAFEAINQNIPPILNNGNLPQEPIIPKSINNQKHRKNGRKKRGECGICSKNKVISSVQRGRGFLISNVCKHTFCAACWKNWLRKMKKNSCPICRTELYFDQLFTEKEMELQNGFIYSG